MEFDLVVCKACGNIYMVSEGRHFCPVCSGEPLSLEGTLAVVTATAEPAPEAQEPGEEVVKGEVEEPTEEPAPKKRRRRKAK